METVVFTNGCFDLIHPGHIDLLERARALGDKLIVGINSDASVRAIKGQGRPLMPQDDRRRVLAALRSVDEVVIFEELTPESLIRRIRPNVLVKGGDWKPEEIVGSDFVLSYGGKVFSLPLVMGYSTSKIVSKVNEAVEPLLPKPLADNEFSCFGEHMAVFQLLDADHLPEIDACFDLLFQTFETGRKVMICGNGGSAADAQHLAAEFVGRYEMERRALPAIALTTDTSALTALANDYDFERVFSRQVEALADEGDCLIAISTSGSSANVIAAVMSARKAGCKTIGMTGEKGKKLAALCDSVIKVPSARTSRIQEAHIAIAHYWCEKLDQKLGQTK